MPSDIDLVTDPGPIREPAVEPCWAGSAPMKLDALGSSLLQLKLSTREMERIAAQLTVGDRPT